MKYLLELKYNGKNYHGFQVQDNHETIQENLIKAANTVFNTDSSTIIGCSRTDASVSAKQYFATLSVPSGIEEKKVPKALNTYLPKDICVYKASIVDEEYAIHEHVMGKEYIYTILNGDFDDPFYTDSTFFYNRKLDVDKMNEAAEHIIGKKDFKCFMASGSKIEDTVRTVEKCFAEVENEDGNRLVKIHVQADGFLYNMVRIISGTLLEVSEGKIDVCEIEEIIESKDRLKAGRTLPGKGLVLNRVFIK